MTKSNLSRPSSNGKVMVKGKEYNIDIAGCLDLPRLNIRSLRDISLENANPDAIKTLNLSDNNIINLDGIDSFQNLENLSLSNNNLGSIEGLQSCKKLKEIRLDYNRLKRIDELKDSKYLNIVNLSYNHLISTDGLEECINLTELYMDNNHIERVNNLDHLKNLFIINLAYNKLKDFNGIRMDMSKNGCDSAELDVSHNDIAGTISLDEFKGSDVHFNASWNHIFEVTLTKEIWFGELNLSYNCLTSVEFARKLRVFEAFVVRGNPITSLAPAEENREIARIE